MPAKEPRPGDRAPIGTALFSPPGSSWGENVTRPRAADDLGTIRARIEELHRELLKQNAIAEECSRVVANKDPLRDIERRRKEKCEGWPPPWVPTIFFKTRRSSSRVEPTPLSSGRHPPAVDVVSGTRGVARALGARRVPPAPMPRIGASCFHELNPRTAFARTGRPGHRREAGHPPRRGDRAPFGVTGIPRSGNRSRPLYPAPRGGGLCRSPACRAGVSLLCQSRPLIVNIAIRLFTTGPLWIRRNRRLVSSPAIPLIDRLGPVIGENRRLFVRVGNRSVVSI